MSYFSVIPFQDLSIMIWLDMAVKYLKIGWANPVRTDTSYSLSCSKRKKEKEKSNLAFHFRKTIKWRKNQQNFQRKSLILTNPPPVLKLDIESICNNNIIFLRGPFPSVSFMGKIQFSSLWLKAENHLAYQ